MRRTVGLHATHRCAVLGRASGWQPRHATPVSVTPWRPASSSDASSASRPDVRSPAAPCAVRARVRRARGDRPRRLRRPVARDARRRLDGRAGCSSRLNRRPREPRACAKLRDWDSLGSIADGRASNMASSSALSHDAAGGDLGAESTQRGIQWYSLRRGHRRVERRLGRCVRRRTSTRLWKASPPHWALLLSRDYNYIGIGFAYRSAQRHDLRLGRVRRRRRTTRRPGPRSMARARAARRSRVTGPADDPSSRPTLRASQTSTSSTASTTAHGDDPERHDRDSLRCSDRCARPLLRAPGPGRATGAATLRVDGRGRVWVP